MAGCDKPESGSLENVKNRKDLQAGKLDYSKIDYGQLDYGKLDASKIDVSKLDVSKLDVSKLDVSKLDKRALTKIAESNVALVSAPKLTDEVLRRLNESRTVAVEAKDEKLMSEIDAIIKAVERNKVMIGDVMCW